MNHRAYLGLGSNQGDRMAYLQQALQQLAEQDSIRLLRCSSVYETAPVGFLDQPAFYNMVCEIETSLAPLQLLAVVLDVERQLKRTRTIRWGPRTIDIDILLYDQALIRQRDLMVPHPRMTERAFVLVPLAELIPDQVIPGTNLTVRQWQDEIPEEQTVRCLPQTLQAPGNQENQVVKGG